MKIRCRNFLLLPLALGLLTTACKDDSAKGPSKSEVAPKPKAPKATPQERAAKLGAVAMIPSGSSCVLSVYDLDGIARDASSTHVGAMVSSMLGGKSIDKDMESAESAETKVDPSALMDGESKDVTVPKNESQPTLPAGAADAGIPVKDIVISLGNTQPEFLTAIEPLYSAFMLMQNASYIMVAGGTILKDGPEKSKMFKMTQEYMEKNLSGSIAKLVNGLDLTPSKGTAPFLAIATLSSETKTQVEGFIAQMSAMAPMLTQGMLAPYSVKASGFDFTGVVLDGKMCGNALNQLIASQEDEAMKMAYSQMKEKLQTCKIYVLTAFKGNQLISVICTNPEQQIRLAATPAESVLAQDDFSFVDGNLKDQLAGISYISPAMLKSLVSFATLSSDASYKGYAEGVRQLSGPFGTTPEAVNSICSGITKFASSYGKMATMSDMSKASTCVAWRKDGLKVVMTGGMCSALNWDTVGSLSGVNSQALPGVALTGFCSFSPELVQLYYTMMEGAGATVWKAASAIMGSPNADVSDHSRMVYEKIKTVEPEIEKIWEAAGLYVSAMSGNRAMAIKLDGDMPQCVSSEYRGGKTPRIAVADKLNDRKKVDEAWTMFKLAANAIATKQGMPAPFGSNLVVKQEGNSYWYEMKEINGEGNFQPGVTVDNSLLVLGTSKDWNESVFKAASTSVTGNTDAVGIYANVSAWTRFIGDWIKLTCEKDGEDVSNILNAFSRDVESINYSVSKEGDLMIQNIDFKAAR